MSPDDLILVLTPSELDTMRTALRNEQERYERQGFNGLKVAVQNLRDKISNGRHNERIGTCLTRTRTTS
jgi:hypothetical protein